MVKLRGAKGAGDDGVIGDFSVAGPADAMLGLLFGAGHHRQRKAHGHQGERQKHFRLHWKRTSELKNEKMKSGGGVSGEPTARGWKLVLLRTFSAHVSARACW